MMTFVAFTIDSPSLIELYAEGQRYLEAVQKGSSNHFEEQL